MCLDTKFEFLNFLFITNLLSIEKFGVIVISISADLLLLL